MSDTDCVFQFMKNLMSLTRFDTEVFKVLMGVSDFVVKKEYFIFKAANTRNVELYVGQHYGIAYKNENTNEVSKNIFIKFYTYSTLLYFFIVACCPCRTS